MTHGRLAPELLAAARVISGDFEMFEALALDWSDSYDEAHSKLEEVLARLDEGKGILIFTDVLGGTPFNVAMAFRAPGRIEIVSGVNLPMVVRLGCLLTDDMELSELANWIRDKGRSSIRTSADLPRAESTLAAEAEGSFASCEENDD